MHHYVLIESDQVESVGSSDDWATVAVDVIRATTTAITAVTLGWRCFPVADLESALTIAASLDNPLLAGELGGNVPYGFHLDNSPADVARRSDVDRPLVLLSSSGTRLMTRYAAQKPVYAACLRNYSAQAVQLVRYHPRVALIGATSRGEFREEDQLCCALLAARLMQAGYEPLGETRELVERWSGAQLEDAFAHSNSVSFLRATGRSDDLDFISEHVDDVHATFVVRGGELLLVPVGE